MPSPYGYCPQCGKPGSMRERCINGHDVCESGHRYLSREARSQPFTEAECDPNKEVTQSDLNQLERQLDSIWSAVGVDVEFTKHFLDRVNDARNGRQITVCELQRLFGEAFKQQGKKIVGALSRRDMEGVLKDRQTDVNSPFILKWTGKELELVAKTVMRKRNFLPGRGDRVFTMESAGLFESMVERLCRT